MEKKVQKLRYYGAAHTDPGGKANEDSFLLMKHKSEKDMILLACIADGVGGMEAGRLASSFIRESFAEWFEIEKGSLIGKGFEELTEKIYKKLMEIHEALKVFERERNIRCGSTVTLALLMKNKFLIIHVGDSRAYICMQGNIRQITKDQTVAQMERDMGRSRSEDDIVNKRKESTLLQCMGVGRLVPQVYEGELQKEYALLLCSDGLTNTLEKEDIREELEKSDVYAVKQHLINLTLLARERKEKDNITSILIKRSCSEVEDEAEAE